MSYSNNAFAAYDSDETLRVEIAILQEDISATNPKTASFTIPALMTEQYKGRKYVNNYNVINKNRTGTPSISTITIDNTVKLYVPKEYTKWYGSIIVPKGTKFIVAFVGGDINSMRIIGRYDKPVSENLEDYVYELPTSTRNRLRRVIIGEGLNINNAGVLTNASKPIPDETIDNIVESLVGSEIASKITSDEIDKIFNKVKENN